MPKQYLTMTDQSCSAGVENVALAGVAQAWMQRSSSLRLERSGTFAIDAINEVEFLPNCASDAVGWA